MARPDILLDKEATQPGVKAKHGSSSMVNTNDVLTGETMSLPDAIALGRELGLAVTPGFKGKVWFRLGDLVI